MASTFFAENLNASAQTTLGGDIVFDKATNDLTFTVADQTSGTATATIPDLAGVSQGLILESQTQTLTNKTLGASTILSTTEIGDNVDNTKQVAFDISEATTGTTTTLDFNQTGNQTISFPDASGTMALQPSGLDNQLLRMNMTDMTQASSVTLSDNNEFANVRSLTAESGQDLTLTAATGQDIVLSTDAGQKVSVAQNLEVTGDTTITGDLTVNGTTTTVNSTTVNIADNNLLISSNYTTAVARPGGITVNYLPTAATASVSGAAFASTSTVNAAGGGYSANDVILIEGANDPSNNGIFQVMSYVDPLITIDTTPSHQFLGNTLVADATVAGTITTINVAVLCAGTDGKFEVANGSDASALTFVDLALVSDIPAGGWTEVTVNTTDATLTTAATIPVATSKSSTLEVVYSARDQGSNATVAGKQQRSFENTAGTVSSAGAGSKDNSVVGTASGWAGGSPQNSVNTAASAGNMLIRVQGAAATTIDWTILYRATESP